MNEEQTSNIVYLPYLLYVNNIDCLDSNTQINIKSSDGWIITNVQYQFYDVNKLKVSLPENIKFPIQLIVFNNKINTYPYLNAEGGLISSSSSSSSSFSSSSSSSSSSFF